MSNVYLRATAAPTGGCRASYGHCSAVSHGRSNVGSAQAADLRTLALLVALPCKQTRRLAVSTHRLVAPSCGKTGEVNQVLADAICRDPQFLSWRAGSIDPESRIAEYLCPCYIPTAERCEHNVAATHPERIHAHLVRTWIWL